jgi:hypothetical protein
MMGSESLPKVGVAREFNLQISSINNVVNEVPTNGIRSFPI